MLGGGRKVARPTLRLTTAALAVGGLLTGGSRTVEVHLKRGALRLAWRLRAGRTVKLTLATSDAAGGRQKLTLAVRAAR